MEPLARAARPPALLQGGILSEEADARAWAEIVWPRQRRLARQIRAVRRGVLAALWTCACIPVQSVLVSLPGASKMAFSRFYWKGVCWLIGLNVRVVGAVAPVREQARPIVYVSNHSSWLDVAVLGGSLSACFIAKEEVGRWPVVRTIARLGRTVYVRRSRGSLGRERDTMADRLAAGDNLFLFPEGTTSDGARVLPFRSAFLSVATLPVTASGRTPVVQPISVVYDRLADLPAGRVSRPLFAWFGDMDIGSHFWRLAQHTGLRATVLLHPPLDPETFESRKALAAETFRVVAEGAAILRQNRPTG